jgi:hypothetical protein
MGRSLLAPDSPTLAEAQSAARAAGAALGVDHRPLLRWLHGGDAALDAWLDSLGHLGVPLPGATLAQESFSLSEEPGARILERRSMLQAFDESGRPGPVPDAPARVSPRRRWWRRGGEDLNR